MFFIRCVVAISNDDDDDYSTASQLHSYKVIMKRSKKFASAQHKFMIKELLNFKIS
jgi:hypothetical protein